MTFDVSSALDAIAEASYEPAQASHTCALCNGAGDNTQGLVMRVNDHICVRCGGYGFIPSGCVNPPALTAGDLGYATNNGWDGRLPV